MKTNLPFKVGVWVRLRRDHIEDEGATFQAGQSGQVIGYDTPSLVMLRMPRPNSYITCVSPGELALVEK